MRVMINLYKITQGIQNLITWFPIIWKDRQWDHYYFMVILHKKLSLMEEHISKHRIHVGWERDVFKIKRSRLTLDRLIKDEIYWEGYIEEKHEFKWGDPDKRIDFDMDYLFSQIRKHLRSWWD